MLRELLTTKLQQQSLTIFSPINCVLLHQQRKKINDINKGYFGTCSCLFNFLFLKKKKQLMLEKGKEGESI